MDSIDENAKKLANWVARLEYEDLDECRCGWMPITQRWHSGGSGPVSVVRCPRCLNMVQACGQTEEEATELAYQTWNVMQGD